MTTGFATENEQDTDWKKKYTRLERQLKKLERDYRALAIRHEQTERLRDANEAAKELSTFYNRLLLRNTPNITFLLDLDMQFVMGSDKAVALLGGSDMRAMTGLPFAALFAKAMPAGWIDDMSYRCEQAVRTGEPANYRDAVPVAGGEEHVFQTMVTPADEQNGGVRGVAVVMNDVTELARAREEAERSSRAKSDFLSNMSHEIRTPMNAIIGMTSLARRSSDPEKKDACLEKIDHASTHLLGVINDILDMSKIEANKFELSFAPFTVEKTLHKAANFVSFRVAEKQLRFSVEIDQNIPLTVIGDDQRLAQVVINLLSNAVKFTPDHGEIRLEARLEQEKQGLCTILVSVTDTGIGISAEVLPRLFTSFEQAEQGTARKFGGTGLGLAISRRIVEMMGGRIWAVSEPDKGSTFAFTIRAQRALDEKGTLLKPDTNWRNLRVLVVDDDPGVTEYFTGLLKDFGVACDVAFSAREALALHEKNAYDIYFVDWQMPEMNGTELSLRLREKTGQADKSVIIMISAADWEVVGDEARRATADKFLSKPLFRSAVFDCINDCLQTENRLATEESPAGITGQFEGRRAILAEDIEINREIVLALLEPTRLAVDCAENGAEAVRLFSANPEKYDMILMDVQMPEMDGYEATRRIRSLSLPGAASVPIVAMTANAFREDVEKCIQAGMNDHLAKPLNFDQVLHVLHKYLPPDRRGGRNSGGRSGQGPRESSRFRAGGPTPH